MGTVLAWPLDPSKPSASRSATAGFARVEPAG